MGIVYKVWYNSKTNYFSPYINVEHVRYIATRPGVICNQESGFGLWGKTGDMEQAGDFQNLDEQLKVVREESKKHTLYCAVLSLKEEEADSKGVDNREAWQKLVSENIQVIAKENDIEPGDLRWCAAYHQKRGQPHTHLVFWDASDRIHNEHTAAQRFEISAEHIRAAFNRQIFREELREIQSDQAAARADIRAGSTNIVPGLKNMLFLDEDTGNVTNRKGPCVYPEELPEVQALELADALEEVLLLLPKSGQLKYRYQAPPVKEMLDKISEILLQTTNMKKAHGDYLDNVMEAARVYGNGDEAVARQVEIAHRKILTDIGNDVLRIVKEQEWLGLVSLTEQLKLRETAGQATIERADEVFSKKLLDEDFEKKIQELTELLPSRMTPIREVLADGEVSERLRQLVLECIKDEELQRRLQLAQAMARAAKPYIPEPGGPQRNANAFSLEEPEVDYTALLDNPEKLREHLLERGRLFSGKDAFHSWDEVIEKLLQEAPCEVVEIAGQMEDGYYSVDSDTIFLRRNMPTEDLIFTLAKESAIARCYETVGFRYEDVGVCAAIQTAARFHMDCDWIEIPGFGSAAENAELAQQIYNLINESANMPGERYVPALLENPKELLHRPEQYRSYLQMRGLMHNYSEKNLERIYSQKPGATMVMGEGKWRRMGRRLKEDAVAITILQPKKENGALTFEEAAVYDIADTEGDGAITFVREPEEDILLEMVNELEEHAPVPIVVEEGGAKEGAYDPERKVISLPVGMNELERFHAVIRESAHARIHQSSGDMYIRNEMVCLIANCAAVTVCSRYGVNSSRYDISLVEKLYDLPNADRYSRQFVQDVQIATGPKINGGIQFSPLEGHNPFQRDKKEKEVYRNLYRYLHRKIYEEVTDRRGWTGQRKMNAAVHFLIHFCRFTRHDNNNYRNHLEMLRREMSKQAKKEMALKKKDTTHVWD